MKPGEATVTDVDVTQIEPSPYQPRRQFEPGPMTHLTDSIRRNGVQQPIVVRCVSATRFQLVAGERRWRASRLAGLTTVPALVRVMSDEEAQEVALIENELRQNLNPMEVAEACQRLLDRGLSIDEAATRVSLEPSYIRSAVQLLNLRPEYQGLVRKGQLTWFQASALSRCPRPHQGRVFQRIAAEAPQREVSRLVTAIVEAERQSEMFTPDAGQSREAVIRLRAALDKIERHVGGLYSKKTLELLGWVREGQTSDTVERIALIRKQLALMEQALARARARHQVRERKAS